MAYGSLSDIYGGTSPAYPQSPGAAYPVPSGAVATAQGETVVASGPTSSVQGAGMANFAIPGWFIAVVAAFVVLRFVAEKGTSLGTV